jgi:TolB protein
MIRPRHAALLCLLALSATACHRRRSRYVVDEAPVVVVASGPARVLNATGVGRALTRVTSDPIDELMPSISPAGDVVLFETRVYGNGQVTQSTIVGVEPEAGAMRTMYTSASAKSGTPTWMPDGSAIVFTTDSSGRPSLVKSLAAQPNAALTVITGGDAAPYPKRPSISPDGHRVAFQAEMRGKPQIMVAGLDGSRVTILGDGQRPAWSPDGHRLAFSRKVNDATQIFLINADTGTNLVQITNDLGDNDNPTWSPNGRLIVFNSNRGWDHAGGVRDAVWNIYAIKPDGTGLLQLTDGDSDSGAPCWGRDGWIYFHSNQAGNYDIWRMHPVGELESMGAPATRR